MHPPPTSAARTPSPPPSAPPPSPRPRRTRWLGPGRTAALLTVAAGLLTALVAARWGPLIAFDRTVAEGLHRPAVAEPGLTRANRLLTDWIWDPWTMRLLAAVAVVAVWLRGERLLALWVAAASALGAAVSQGLKWAVGRERPQWPDPVDSAHFAAYPSGHAMAATVTCGLLLWLMWRHGVGRWPWRAAVAVAAVSVVGVGITRLWLGVHWSSDVLGGWLLGGAVVAFSIALFRRVTLSREP
ncbi:phosphatase PAP2 family protein [Streptomyces sp. NPDC101062]|uniref:phosphatase PAP2 family protein n=1 Tax=unclassified Streptomyces TaxID=2593676 RepID=UPI002E7A3079|nr:phosphatase PAP2 family protein [Streptomyces sp. JV176]MEE1801228.1 phosphatase PAP2 family protein [Streptomyces sp. JV176]